MIRLVDRLHHPAKIIIIIIIELVNLWLRNFFCFFFMKLYPIGWPLLKILYYYPFDLEIYCFKIVAFNWWKVSVSKWMLCSPFSFPLPRSPKWTWCVVQIMTVSWIELNHYLLLLMFGATVYASVHEDEYSPDGSCIIFSLLH